MIKGIAILSAIALTGCTGSWDEIRNSPEQQVHDKQVCVAGGMEYATNAYGEVKGIHPKEPSHDPGQ